MIETGIDYATGKPVKMEIARYRMEVTPDGRRIAYCLPLGPPRRVCANLWVYDYHKAFEYLDGLCPGVDEVYEETKTCWAR